MFQRLILVSFLSSSCPIFQDLHAGIEIKAANGKPYPALKVFSHSLRFFKDHVLAELFDQSTAKLTEDDIMWVITVPAIWRQPAKQFMRTAAYEVSHNLYAFYSLIIWLE